jgi:hypothetical protein
VAAATTAGSVERRHRVKPRDAGLRSSSAVGALLPQCFEAERIAIRTACEGRSPAPNIRTRTVSCAAIDSARRIMVYYLTKHQRSSKNENWSKSSSIEQSL